MIAENNEGVHTTKNAEKVANLMEKADKKVSEWIKRGVMTKAQADKYMNKQLIRIGGKVFGEYGKKPCTK